MTQPKRLPKTERLRPKLDALDPLLKPEESAMLHLPAAVMSAAWQEAQSCADPDCIGCRIGRAMAWATKACKDIDLTLEVLEGLIDLVPRDPVLGPRFQPDLAHVSLHEMERVATEMAYWAKNLGYSCGLSPVDDTTDEVGVAVSTDDEGAVVASVLRRQRDPGEGGKAN